ncbi:MAG TPA: sel1 repeat family protein, partial [Arcobacter sp.]|nr:sel1 repeat family protein [Arcobacter sp.]
MANDELKNEAMELFNAKEYAKSLELYQYLANQGDLASLSTVGYFYHNGLAVEQSYQKAIEYYEKAAKEGEHSSAYNLGLLYFRG